LRAWRCAAWSSSLQAVVLPELQRLCARAQQRARDAAATAAAVAEQAAARQHHPSEPPAHLLCPITQQLMEHPVVAADGHTYERAAMEAWLRSERARGRSPLTNMPLEHTRLVTNYAVKAALEEWALQQQQRGDPGWASH
jgi:hypothetical protein